jgi:hypothetical protein
MEAFVVTWDNALPTSRLQQHHEVSFSIIATRKCSRLKQGSSSKDVQKTCVCAWELC